MNTAKIRLSPKEMELVRNADWILTKNHIIQKAKTVTGKFTGNNNSNTYNPIRKFTGRSIETITQNFKRRKL